MAEGFIPAIPPFNLEGESVAERWEKYKKSFAYYAAAMKATTPVQKKGLLLHIGGTQLQDVYETLVFNDDNPMYDQVITAFDARFTPLRNSAYERHVFSSAK